MNNENPGGQESRRPPVNPDRGAMLSGEEKNPAARPQGQAPRRAPAPRRPQNAADGATRVRPAVKAKGADGPRPKNGGPGGGGKRPPARRPVDRKGRPKGRVRVSTVLVTSLLNVLKALLVMVCVILIAVSLVAVQVVDYVVSETQNDENILDLEHIKLNETSYIMALNPDNPNAAAENDWIEYQELIGPENRIWVALEDGVPDHLVNAVVATEDKEFFDHHGVNFRRTIAALANELFEFENTFGASTIEQQLVKNITGEGKGGTMSQGKDGYQRKLREIFRAWGLDNNYSKDMIMEAYLNTMPLSERIAGMQAAALEYFNKDVQDLNLWECATIAGITRAPTYYSPYQNPDNCLVRRNDVLTFMRRDNYITEAEYREALEQPLGVTKRTTKDESGESRVIFNYFSDTVFNAVVDDMVEQQIDGITTRKQAVDKLYTGGYRIYATVEDRVQSALEDIYLDGYNPETGFFLDGNRFPGYEYSLTRYDPTTGEPVLPQSAAAVINYDGALVGVIGGIGEKTVSLGLNRAVGTVKYDSAGQPYVDGSVRQVGSTMKMVAAYPVALDKGIITYSTGVINGPVLAIDSPVPNWPTNYGGDPGTNTPMPVAAAVSVSANTVAARVGSWVSPEEMYEFATDTLQVTSLVGPDLPTNDVGLAPMVLGAMTYGMSAYELAGAYMMYGGNDTYGVYNSLHCYTKVEDSKGNLVLQPERTTVQAIDPATGYVGNRLLSNVLRDTGLGVLPTALGMAPNGEMDSVAKTGTTTEDNDRWLVGLTPYYVTAVWWGYDANNVLNAWGGQQTLQGWPTSPYTNVTTNVWKTVMETVQEGKEYKDFPAVPANVVADYYCTSSGALASPGCPAMLGYYNAEHLPDYCPGHTRPAAPGEDEEGEGGEEGAAEGGGEPAPEG